MANGKHWMTPSPLPRAKMLALQRYHAYQVLVWPLQTPYSNSDLST